MGRFDWREDDIWNVAKGLSWGSGRRYTVSPPKIRYYPEPEFTYQQRCNRQWERLPMLQDSDVVNEKIADGWVWDRNREKFVILDVPYEIEDNRGNIRIL